MKLGSNNKIGRKTLVIPLVTFAIGVGIVVVATQMLRPPIILADHVIALQMDTASPDALTAKVGDTVEFATRDGRQHNIYQGSDMHSVMGTSTTSHIHMNQTAGIMSGKFGAGQSYRVTLSKTGTFNFHDQLHPELSATIIVYQSSGK